MHQKTQVVIIGAGPTGLSLATQLLRYQIDFIIIEKNERTTPFSKALVVQARSLEILNELGLAQRAINRGRITTALNLFHKGKQKAAINIAGLGNGLSPYPFALSLEQSKTEKLLVEYLSENNHEILWKSEFIRFEQKGNSVWIYFKDASQQEQIIEAGFLVGCDGAGSLVRHQMGILFEGDTVPKIFYVADVKLKSPVIQKDELYIFLIKKGFILFFPMEGEEHYRIVGILPDRTDENEQFTFGDIENGIINEIEIPVHFDKVMWFSSYKVHSRKAGTFMGDRCFIAGDAAHIHTPAGGQGMNTGIQDAYNLAWKMAFSIRYKTSALVLESYNTERLKNAVHLLQTTDRMFDIMAGTNKFWNFVRLKIFPNIIHFVLSKRILNKRIFPLISDIGIAYPDSQLTIKSSVGNINAGDRMPYFEFSDGSKIFDYLSEPCFKILYFGKDQNHPFGLFENQEFKISKHPFSEIPASIFKNHKEFYILLRPDNHISYLGKDPKICMDIFTKIISR
jgi:2-polyprenyl-6-methoxyphenol hydroxylase-like FAD-dependent oxidoreductase